MNTHRETIVAAIVARLKGATPFGSSVHRARAEAFSRDELPAIAVKPGAEQKAHASAGLVERRLAIHLDFHARESAGQTIDQVIDPALAAAHAALMQDQTLAGAVLRLIEGDDAEIEIADADQTAGRLSVTYTAVYLTTTADRTRPAT